MRIQHNIMAMNAYRNYTNNTSALSANLEKLSSGYKINRAGDDAAGLAISEKMRAQITGLDQAADNVKDGISLVKTAEGALQEVQDMLNRMVELATQSANGTYEDSVDRANLQAEVDQLTTEINRIADSANFNGIKLLDGTMSTKEATPTEVANLADETVFTDMGIDVIKDKVMLDKSATNDPYATGTTDGVGKATILQTTADSAKAPGFSIDLNGLTHNVTTAGTETIKLELDDGSTTNWTLTEGVDITEATGTALNAETLAKKFADKIGNTATLDGKVYEVKADGESINFTLTDAVSGPTNQYYTVKMTASAPQSTPKDIASTTSYTLTAGDADNKTTATGGKDVLTATAKLTLEDGTTVSFNTAKQDLDATASTIATALQNLSATGSDGNTYKLSDYYTVANANTNDIVFTAVAAGADGNNTSIELTLDSALTDLTTGTAANAGPVAADPGDATVKDGISNYAEGTGGYVQFGTTKILQADKVPGDQLASTSIDLNKVLLDDNGDLAADGVQIRLGDQTYTIAIGEDSQFKDRDDAVYLESVDSTAANAVAQIASKLSEKAVDNTLFTVGQSKGNNGIVTLKQKDTEEAKAADLSTMEKFAAKIGFAAYDETASQAVADANAAEQERVDQLNEENAANDAKYRPLTLQIGDTSDSYNQMEVSIADMHANAIGSTDADGNLTSIEDISIKTATDAQAAVSVIKDAINQVSSTRGNLGAIQNRLEHTSNNLSVMTENIQDAESTIRDTDIAEEMMSYTKNNILLQSAQAMLAQANQVPQGVLQLLQ
jgi:flagellin